MRPILLVLLLIILLNIFSPCPPNPTIPSCGGGSEVPLAHCTEITHLVH